jgi:hypothetical protein
MKTRCSDDPTLLNLRKQARRVLKSSINSVQQRWAKPIRVKHSTTSKHIYEIRPRVDNLSFDLISDAFPYSPLWYRGPNAIRDAIDYVKFFSRSHDAVIRVFDEAGNVIESYEYAGDFKSGELLLRHGPQFR